MSRDIALLLADVDGTLVTKDKVLTPRALRAVTALKHAGIKFAITSGRPPRGMKMLIGPLELETPLAGFNGGVFVNPDLSVISAKTLPGDVTRETIALMEKAGIGAWIYTESDWIIRNLDEPHVEREAKTVQFRPRVVNEFADEDLDRVVKVVGNSEDIDKVAACEKSVQTALGNRASAARSQPYYLDVTHPDANKGGVLRELSRMLSIPAEKIATIGDMPNDVSMFKPAGFSVAMGQASDEVKRQASAVTDGYEDEGFAKAVEKYILGDAE